MSNEKSYTYKFPNGPTLETLGQLDDEELDDLIELYGVPEVSADNQSITATYLEEIGGN